MIPMAVLRSPGHESIFNGFSELTWKQKAATLAVYAASPAISALLAPIANTEAAERRQQKAYARYVRKHPEIYGLQPGKGPE